MSKRKCGRCGKDHPADGLASVNGVYFCHEDEGATCYILGPHQACEHCGGTSATTPGRLTHTAKDCPGMDRDLLIHGQAWAVYGNEGHTP